MFTFRLSCVSIVLLAVAAFNPTRFSSHSKHDVQMTSENKISINKILSTAVIAASLLSTPAFAKEGAGAKFSFFGDSDFSSPYTVNEKREDPIYSPYSPYGNGEAAVYNGRKGSAEEVAFWKQKLETSLKRVDNVPSFASKKQWENVRTELTSYSYNLREALLRVADSAKYPADALASAKRYFSHINDIFEGSVKKDGAAVVAAYDASVKEIALFKSLL